MSKSSIRKLEKSDFIVLLCTSTDKKLTFTECERLHAAYERFIDRIQRLSKRENQSKLDSMHTLARIRERIARLLERCDNKHSVQYSLLKSALALIGFEKKMIYLQLKYPGIKDVQSPHHRSALKISKKYTNSDLMEIIASLSAVEFFCLYDDSPASFMQITREFELLCNTRIKNPDNCRWAVLNRKNRLTHFLDTLRNTLVELSRK